MGVQDANFNAQIFRKDNPIILACRRDKAVFMGARLTYDGNDYNPGACLVRVTSTGLFSRWSAASGGTYDSPCVLFDQVTVSAQQANQDGSSGASAATLVRVLMEAIVYTGNLIEGDANFKTAIKSVDRTDSGGVQMTKF